MILPIFYRWGVFIAYVKWDKKEQRFHGRVGRGVRSYTFVTRKFLNIVPAARWAHESEKGNQ